MFTLAYAALNGIDLPRGLESQSWNGLFWEFADCLFPVSESRQIRLEPVGGRWVYIDVRTDWWLYSESEICSNSRPDLTDTLPRGKNDVQVWTQHLIRPLLPHKTLLSSNFKGDFFYYEVVSVKSHAYKVVRHAYTLDNDVWFLNIFWLHLLFLILYTVVFVFL